MFEIHVRMYSHQNQFPHIYDFYNSNKFYFLRNEEMNMDYL